MVDFAALLGGGGIWESAIGSQIEHHVVARPRAADQRAPGGGRFDRLGVVVDGAGDERRLAGVADAGAARPADGYVAGLSELEQARVVVAPRDREVAAREPIVGPLPGLAGGRVRRPRRRRRDARRDPAAGPNGSVWMWEASRPIAARPALMSSMNGVGPHTYASASRGGSSSASTRRGETARAVEVAAFAVVRIGTAVEDGAARSGSEASSARASVAKQWSRPLRAPCSHQISRWECSCASAWSMARTGVAPMPALISSTGASRPVEDERAARRGDVELGRRRASRVWRYPLAAPCARA